MKLEFDLDSVTVTEFGVGRGDDSAQTFVAVSVDADVQVVLHEMVRSTVDAMHEIANGPAKYEPSEKYGTKEDLYLPLTDDLASFVRQLHEATNLDMDGSALDKPAEVSCYFARLTDREGRRLTALRRASQFKGVLRKRLIRFVSDSLKLIPEDVFKLDGDFDLLIDSANVYILRPSGFEFTGRLQQAVLDAVPENVTALRSDLSFVDFDGIQAYAAKHPRAARLLASIRGQAETKNIDKTALKNLCKRTGVNVCESKGKITVQPGHELSFLEVLDRRRYELELVKGQPERFRAGSRIKLAH